MAGTSKDDRTGPYEQIYRRIIEGVYRPGERLIEQRIAEELAVSRTPVREALVRLEGAGLVVNARHKGAMVRSLTREDIVDLYELRSEEHTSELQSHVNLVCRLLLEKK